MRNCADCGYLSVRNRADYGLVEPDIDFRRKGIVATGYNDEGQNPHPLHAPIPLCFAMQPYLGGATKNIQDRKNPSDEVKKIIQADNDCREFIDWQQGFTPKEHREMMDRKKLRCWRIMEIVLIVVLSGLFTLLGAYIGSGGV